MKVKPSTIIMLANKCSREEARALLKNNPEEAKKILKKFAKKA